VPRRKLLESDWYTERFPKTKLAEIPNLKERYDSTAGGYMHSCVSRDDSGHFRVVDARHSHGWR
jgi:hypothetical protein